jgi:hypothetical protein
MGAWDCLHVGGGRVDARQGSGARAVLRQPHTLSASGAGVDRRPRWAREHDWPAVAVAVARAGIARFGSAIGSNASNRQDKPLTQRLKKPSRQRFSHSLLASRARSRSCGRSAPGAAIFSVARRRECRRRPAPSSTPPIFRTELPPLCSPRPSSHQRGPPNPEFFGK